jgi:hypothetical protein
MLIIGCDFHTRYQQIAMAEDKTGEMLLERRLDHQSGEAHAIRLGSVTHLDSALLLEISDYLRRGCERGSGKRFDCRRICDSESLQLQQITLAFNDRLATASTSISYQY